MKRREFLGLVGGTVAVLPAAFFFAFAAHAAEPDFVPPADLLAAADAMTRRL